MPQYKPKKKDFDLNFDLNFQQLWILLTVWGPNNCLVVMKILKTARESKYHVTVHVIHSSLL